MRYEFTTFPTTETNNDYTGTLGHIFIPNKDITVTSLGRAYGSGSTHNHNAFIWLKPDSGPSPTTPVATGTILSTSASDAHGYKWIDLTTPVKLLAGKTYYVLTNETSGQDYWDNISIAGSATLLSPDVVLNGHVYGDTDVYPYGTNGDLAVVGTATFKYRLGMTAAEITAGWDGMPNGDGIANLSVPQGGFNVLSAGYHDIETNAIEVDSNRVLSGQGDNATIIMSLGTLGVGFGTLGGSGSAEKCVVRDLGVTNTNASGVCIGRSSTATVDMIDCLIERVQFQSANIGIQLRDPSGDALNNFRPRLRDVTCRSSAKRAIDIAANGLEINNLDLVGCTSTDASEPLVYVHAVHGRLNDLNLDASASVGWAGPLLSAKTDDVLQINNMYLEQSSTRPAGVVVLLDGGDGPPGRNGRFFIDTCRWVQPQAPWKLINGAQLFANAIDCTNNFGVRPAVDDTVSRLALLRQCFDCEPGCGVYLNGDLVAGSGEPNLGRAASRLYY